MDGGRRVRRRRALARGVSNAEQHFTNPDDYAKDIVRLEFLASKGWTIVRVSAVQLRHQRAEVVQRVRLALRQRGFPD
jgi:very-short-patch-repair endonuclease